MTTMKKETPLSKSNFIFFDFIAKEKVWANPSHNNYLEKKINQKKVGELWFLSGLPKNESFILNGEYKGYTLEKLWNEKRDLFPSSSKLKEENYYPLLTKIIAAGENLSVQIHPDDKTAQKYYSFPNGKNEMWYVLENKFDQKIIYGIKDKKLKVFQKKLSANSKKNKLWNLRKAKVGSIIHIPANMVHCLPKGMTVFEIQQTCDYTWRIYDFQRENKSSRKLNLTEIYQNWNQEKEELKRQQNKKFKFVALAKRGLEKLTTFQDFKVIKVTNLTITEKEYKLNANWVQGTIIEGEGKINSYKVKFASSFLALNTQTFSLSGKMTVIFCCCL